LGNLGPEVGAVAGHPKVDQLVDDDVVENPARHALQPVGEPDGAVGRRAGPPPAALVADPANARRHRSPVEIAPRESHGPRAQRGVARPQLAVLTGETLEHRRDPAALLGQGHPCGDQHHGAVAIAV